jgi:hypothetical protein
VIAAIAVTGVRERADSVACCAALAIRDEIGAGAPIVLMPGGRQPRPALLASAEAREHEIAVNSAGLEKVHAAARGHLCLVSAADEDQDAMPLVRELAGPATPLVVSGAPANLEPWHRTLTLVRAELPTDRDVLALLADSLPGSAGLLRVDKRGPGRIGARRALSGLVPGRAPHSRYRRLCRGVR